MRKRALWIWGTVAAVVFLAIGTAAVFSWYYSERALPGTSIAGQDVSGLDDEQILEDLSARVDTATVTLNVGGESRTMTLADLGYQIDEQATLTSVFSPNQSALTRITSSFSSNDVPVEYTVDQEKIDSAVKQIQDETGSAVVDATVNLPEGAESYEFTESSAGLEADTTGLEEGVAAAASTLTPVTVQVSLTEVEPSFTTAQAEALVGEANAFISREVSITDGVDLHVPTQYEKALWLDVSSSGVSVNEGKVRDWVEVAGLASNLDPKAGIRNVNSRGDVVSVVEEGKSGWKANNIPEVADELVSALQAGDGFVGDFDFDEIKSDEWEDRQIADGAEALAYQAAAGEKWIDINLSNYTVSAYEGATIVRGPVAMVPGAPATPTVTGTYKIYHMTPSQTMRGLNADGTKYETPDVPWVAYFTGDYALHGAYWRSEFGYGGPGGSHGCVNMPVDEAKWFYDWAEIGTTVVSH